MQFILHLILQNWFLSLLLLSLQRHWYCLKYCSALLTLFFYCYIGIAKSRNLRNQFLTQNWYNSELPRLISPNFCLQYLFNALNVKTKKMTGHRVRIWTTDGQSFWDRTFWGQIYMKLLEKSNSIVTIYAHSYIRYCWARVPHFIHMNYYKFFLKTCQNIKFNEYENITGIYNLNPVTTF